MAPEAKKSDLAYISNFYNSTILAFTYPRGKYVGSISSDDPQGLCAAKTGNWWVVASGSAEVSEYAHGGTTPLKTLSVTGGEPAGCTVDPTTGNLAVTLLGAGDVVVFTGGSGSGTTIADDLSSSYFDGYDDKGDLFVDGITPSDTYGVVELPRAAACLSNYLSQAPGFPGGIQGYGNYLAIGDHGDLRYLPFRNTWNQRKRDRRYASHRRRRRWVLDPEAGRRRDRRRERERNSSRLEISSRRFSDQDVPRLL